MVLIDAEGLVVGRAAAIIANRLRGKHRAIFTPHIDTGDNVVVINAEKVVLTGNKRKNKTYYWHTGHPGGIKERKAHQCARRPLPERRARGCGAPDDAGRAADPSAADEPAHLPRRQPPARGTEAGSAGHQVHETPRRTPSGRDPMANRPLFPLSARRHWGHPGRRACPAAKPKIDSKGRAYATGKRKNAVARVWIKRGRGKITVNEKAFEAFFARPTPAHADRTAAQGDEPYGPDRSVCTVSGGGLSGQAGAVRHGISRALTYFEPELRGVLKKGGFLTRDSRVVGAQEVRPRQGPPQLPVLEALKRTKIFLLFVKGLRFCVTPFSV